MYAVLGKCVVCRLNALTFHSCLQAAADLHSHLAVCVANEALKIAADPSVRVYCRALSLLDTSRCDKVSLWQPGQ